MNQTTKMNISDQEPLTVGHGRKIYDQNRTIAALVEKLQPLLVLVNEEETAPQNDPISKIVELLTEICKEQILQREEQKSLHRKVDRLIGNLRAAAPSIVSKK